MELVLETYQRNVGLRPMFAEIFDIDFYDGATEAVCRLTESEHFLLCSLIYYNLQIGIRIFTMLEISAGDVAKLKSIAENGFENKVKIYEQLKNKVKVLYATYSGLVFLFFKGNSLHAKEYEVVEMPLQDLIYFNNVEEVLEQRKNSLSKWLDFFQPDK